MSELNARQELLLKGYELCQGSAQSLETPLWQTHASLAVGSIGSALLLGWEASQQHPLRWCVLVFVGVFVVGTNWAWWFMARRRWSIQHANYLRMRHIEEELDLYQQRYVHDFLDDPGRWCANPALKTSGLSEKQKADLLKHSEYQRAGTESVLRVFVIGVTLLWVAYSAMLLIQA